jgi:hypothetical protein
VHTLRLVSIVKMAIMFEDILPKSSILLCVFCLQKDLTKKIFIKKYFLFTVEFFCRVKRSLLGRETWETFR